MVYLHYHLNARITGEGNLPIEGIESYGPPIVKDHRILENRNLVMAPLVAELQEIRHRRHQTEQGRPIRTNHLKLRTLTALPQGTHRTRVTLLVSIYDIPKPIRIGQLLALRAYKRNYTKILDHHH